MLHRVWRMTSCQLPSLPDAGTNGPTDQPGPGGQQRCHRNARNLWGIGGSSIDSYIYIYVYIYVCNFVIYVYIYIFTYVYIYIYTVTKYRYLDRSDLLPQQTFPVLPVACREALNTGGFGRSVKIKGSCGRLSGGLVVRSTTPAKYASECLSVIGMNEV